MNGPFDPAKLRIPVKLVDGKWEYFYGGEVPVANGTVGDLVVGRHAVVDSEFVARLRQRIVHRILDAGVELLVALTIRTELPHALSQHLRKLETHELSPEYGRIAWPGQSKFVGVRIGPPTTPRALQLDRERGGVWLHFEGVQPKGVSVSSVELPGEVSQTPLDSLNHAFTCLSTAYEPWRKSHTGSVYTRMLYQESNGKWYPLETLRRAAEATEEQALLRERWMEIAKKLHVTGNER